MRVDESRIRKEKYTDSKVLGYVWTVSNTLILTYVDIYLSQKYLEFNKHYKPPNIFLIN